MALRGIKWSVDASEGLVTRLVLFTLLIFTGTTRDRRQLTDRHIACKSATKAHALALTEFCKASFCDRLHFFMSEK